MDVIALVGTAAAVIGIPIALLQLKAERAHRHESAVPDDNSLTAKFDDLALFAPSARYKGYDVDVVDRQSESAMLLRQAKAGRSVITIEGIMGIGKTTLAAHLCRQVGDREIHWVFCDEKGAELTITSLARALATGAPPTTRLHAAVARHSGTIELIDAVIDFLATHRMLLVLDNFHTVTDPDIHLLLARLEHSATKSSVLLTSRSRITELHAVPLVAQFELRGLSAGDTYRLLQQRDVRLSEATAEVVWRHAGNGNPLALLLFAGRVSRTTAIEKLLADLPDADDDLNAWIAPVFVGLSWEGKLVAKIIAFGYGPMSQDALRTVAAPLAPGATLAELTERFLVTDNGGRFEMHDAIRDYVTSQTTDAEQAELAKRLTGYYREQARAVFIEGLGRDEPSYGTLYVESFPDYFAAIAQHIQLVDDLLDRLADHGYVLSRGDRILVLGSGDGTHDPGFAKHGFEITNVDIQPEIADRGRAKAAALPADIGYVVADMTDRLPARLTNGDMAAVFNIGSSFGYEGVARADAMVFHNAANALDDDAPFVFEFVNGPYWTNKRIQRQVDVTSLPNGSTRTEVSIANPEAGTSLTLIGLRRPDGTGGWFRHFMRYYRLPEIIDMMMSAGLRPVATYGAVAGRVTGEPFDERRSEAMVIIATRDRAQTVQ